LAVRWWTLAARPVDRLQVLLRYGLDRDKTHVRPIHGFTNAFGVVGVVLLALDVRFDELRRHQPYRVTHLLEDTTPGVCAGARFHPDQARLPLGELFF
jgi:hypothetical protein